MFQGKIAKWWWAQDEINKRYFAKEITLAKADELSAKLMLEIFGK